MRHSITFPIKEREPTNLQLRNAIPGLKIKEPQGIVRLKTSIGQWSPQIQVLVDTGATISVFTKSWCDAIGIELKNTDHCASLGTAGGSKLLVYIHTVDMRIGNEVLSNIHVGFQEGEGTSLLGRIDVFDVFEVNFRLKPLEVEFIRELS
jgi:hypothetical protein